MKYLINLVVVALLVTACEDFPASGEDAYPLNLQIHLQSKTVESLNDLQGELEVTNIANEPVEFTFSSSCQTAYTIHDGGNVIFDNREEYACAAVITHLKLDAGESRTYNISLENIEFKTPPGKGMYTIRAFLRSKYEPHASSQFTIK